MCSSVIHVHSRKVQKYKLSKTKTQWELSYVKNLFFISFTLGKNAVIHSKLKAPMNQTALWCHTTYSIQIRQWKMHSNEDKQPSSNPCCDVFYATIQPGFYAGYLSVLQCWIHRSLCSEPCIDASNHRKQH